MELVNQIRESFPKTIDKSKPIFSALIANDNGDAAIQKQLQDMHDYMQEWISTPDIYEQSGLMLEKTVSFFSYLQAFVDETETSLKNRFRAIFVRNHDTKWGTPYDVKSVFRQYFPHATIYLIENVNKIDSTEPGLANMFVDGDIATATPDAWTLVNCSATKNARFSKSFGIEMNQSGGSLSQEVSVSSSSTYFLHFFMKGKINVQIKDNHNKYWDNTSKEWKNSVVNNSFSNQDWNNCSLYFITNNNASKVTVYFNYVETLTYIDYFRLFAKQPYGSFTVIAHFEGNSAVGAFGLAAGDDDPNTNVGIITAEMSGQSITGDGVNILPSDWNYKDCTLVSDAVSVTDSMAMISKKIDVAASKTYNLSFSFNGKISILVKDNNDKYYDLSTNQWKSNIASNIYTASTSTLRSFSINTNSDTSKLIVEIKLTPPQPRYSNYGYYDKSFLSGVPIGFATDIYEDLLDYLRAQGVRAFLELVVKDY